MLEDSIMFTATQVLFFLSEFSTEMFGREVTVLLISHFDFL